MEDHLTTEVHPYVPDAWIDHTKTKIGYEIPVTLPRIGQANLNPSRYSTLRIAMPPRNEQRLIVHELDADRTRVEAATRRLDTQIILLHDRREALITAAITRELDISGPV